jgi:indoleamine 2,3-dioxygenase
MPILPLPTDSLPLLRRSHLVLAFLLHFYAHTTGKSGVSALPIPSSISIPLVTVSHHLGVPPVVTYSDTVLYNFLPLDPTIPVSIANLPARSLETFTNTRSEEMFYVISAQCEIAGAEALRIMRQSLDELFLADDVALRRLTIYLRKLAVQISLIGDITLSMIKQVDPEDFYHLIRPWFKGGDAEGPSSLGWAFQGVDAASAAESSKSITGSLFSGPSAGQSSLIHAIDIFLTVDHAPKEEGIILNAAPVGSSKPNEATFVQRMLQYMPLQHRSFLLHLSSHPTPLRQLVVAHATSHPRLAVAYDAALEALKGFREKHMRIVSIFIVQQARRQPSERIQRLIGPVVTPVGELRGTGGSPLFKFLKRCRDNTTNAMIGKPGPAGFDLTE